MLFNALLTYIAEKGWQDKAFIAASTKDFDKALAANKTSLADAARITGLSAADIEKAAAWIAEPKDGKRRRTMFAYEKGLIWGNDNYRTNAALVNVALATGNIGRPGGGCVRMGGHQEGYSRPSDAHVGKPAAYVDKLLIEGKGGVHHIWGCDHYKTTLNAHKFKQVYKKRTDIVKDAMNAVPAGDRPALVAAIVDAIKKGGLFAVDVDIVPTRIGEACQVWLPAATSGEMNLTSMNGERRMRLTERYMDPPGEAMPDCLIAARIANHMERVLREMGDAKYADQFKGFDWKTEEDAFMDGYPKHEKGGQHVTYERLSAMGTNGFQEPATTSRTARSSAPSGSMPTASSAARTARRPSWRRSGAACRRPARKSRRRSSSTSSTTGAPTTSGRTPISTRTTSSSWTAGPIPFIEMNPDDMRELERGGGRSRRGLQR